MFQIVSTLMADVPGFALVMMELRGMQPHIQLMDDTWGHDGKCVKACDCLLPDRAEAFVHCLIPPLLPSGPIPDTDSIDSTMESAGFTFRDDCGYLGPGSIPFVSGRPGALIWPFVVSSICAMDVGFAHILGLAQTGYSGSVEGCPA